MASTVLPNGIIIPEKFSRDWYNDLYHNWQELDNLLGGGTPKDGTLTIQKNGDTVGTFSSNQATDETINIEVPTKTSDLNNDSGFITGVTWNDVSNKPSFATVATSGSYTDLSDKPTIPTVNDATLTIQKNGTTVDTFTANASSNVTANITVPTKTSDLTNDSGFITSDNTKIPLAGSSQISGDLIPSTTDTVNLGSPSYQWNQAYIKSLTINGVACGDILTHNVSEFVNVTTAQTVGGQKTFSHGQTGVGRDIYHFASNPYAKNTPPANTSFQYIWFTGNSASQGLTNNWYSSYIEQRVYPDGSAQCKWFIRDTSESGLGIDLFVNGSDKQFRPQANNSTDLGSSTNKWKSFNGINPGALSLPNPSNTISFDTTNWDLTNYSINSYTPPADGWIMLGGYADVIQIDGFMNYGITINKGYDGYCEAFLPVLKGYAVRCRFRNCTRLNNAKFYPCQGNV